MKTKIPIFLYQFTDERSIWTQKKLENFISSLKHHFQQKKMFDQFLNFISVFTQAP